jgi:hypothetical protein
MLLMLCVIVVIVARMLSGPGDEAAQGQVQYNSPNYYTGELVTCRSIAFKYHCTKLELI